MKTDEGVKSQLSISRSDRHDSGKYKCVAENQYGKSELLIYLAVQGKIREWCRGVDKYVDLNQFL
jgi:hypothetical protein